MSNRTRVIFKGEITQDERDLVDRERDRLEFEVAMSSIMAEPETAERERKIAWLKTMRDTTERDRQMEKTEAARIAEWKHDIAVRITVHIGVIAFVVPVAALNGVPLFSVQMTWLVIVVAVLSTLYELWGNHRHSGC